jgi:hypothetical protein
VQDLGSSSVCISNQNFAKMARPGRHIPLVDWL